jgi:hypothetical protein
MHACAAVFRRFLASAFSSECSSCNSLITSTYRVASLHLVRYTSHYLLVRLSREVNEVRCRREVRPTNQFLPLYVYILRPPTCRRSCREGTGRFDSQRRQTTRRRSHLDSMSRWSQSDLGLLKSIFTNAKYTFSK